MPANFSLFRLSVFTREHPSLFAERETKEEFLIRVFSQDFKFLHRNIEYYYVRVGSAGSNIVGRIGRAATLEYHVSPLERLEKTSMNAWRAANTVLDPSDGIDGHKLAVEVAQGMGREAAVLKSLVDHVNEFIDSIYLLEANPIVRKGDFFEFVKEAGAPICYLSIAFTPPNGIWSSESSAKEEVREVVNKTRASKVITILSNKTGLDLSSDGVKDAVDYAESGSGKIRAKATNGRTFSSQNDQEIISVEMSDTASQDDMQEFIADNAERVLGRP